MAAEPIPFPESCARHATCMQEPRILVLEVQETTRRTQLDRIEAKVDKQDRKIDNVNDWIRGAVLAVLLAALGIIGALLKR